MYKYTVERKISTALENSAITNDLEKNGENIKHLLYLSQRFYVPLTV